jgi:putative endonuclease
MNKRAKGQTAYHAGVAAEKSVARYYADRGSLVIADRWRGKGGEIDLIAQDGDGYVFIEVKKSQDFARAAESLSVRQTKRIYAAASEFLATRIKGQLSDVRFDVALVNQTGEVHVIENAFGHF